MFTCSINANVRFCINEIWLMLGYQLPILHIYGTWRDHGCVWVCAMPASANNRAANILALNVSSSIMLIIIVKLDMFSYRFAWLSLWLRIAGVDDVTICKLTDEIPRIWKFYFCVAAHKRIKYCTVWCFLIYKVFFCIYKNVRYADYSRQ